jgi:hypothetical protein
MTPGAVRSVIVSDSPGIFNWKTIGWPGFHERAKR